MSNKQRSVYLLHFAAPIGKPGVQQAQHYIGMVYGAELEIAARLEVHRAGQGAAITGHVAARGITMEVARMWLDVPFGFEAAVKRQGSARRICPLCTQFPKPCGEKMRASVRQRVRESGYEIGARGK